MSSNLERTLAIIKPHAIEHRSAIMQQIEAAGFRIVQERNVKLTFEQATKFYDDKLSVADKLSLYAAELASGRITALCLARENAIMLWKLVMGPENPAEAKQSAAYSLRALYGTDDEVKNAVYGTDRAEDVQRDLRFFFPSMIQEPFPTTTEHINRHLCTVIYQPLTDALYEMAKVRPPTPLEWLANYLLEHNTNKPTIDATNAGKLVQQQQEQEAQSINNVKLCDCITAAANKQNLFPF